MIEAASQEQIIESDVVVVGYGGAGASAAITAHDNSATVTILEKMATGGGDTRLAGGGIVTPTSMEATRHIEALCFGKTGSDIIKTYVENAIKIKDWIQELGGQSEVYHRLEVLYPFPTSPCWPNIPGAEYMEDRRVVGKSEDEAPAEPLWKLLSTNVESRNIHVLTNTRAKELITDEKNGVIGVRANKEGTDITIMAKKAVILTCGGFSYNDSMKDTFLPITPLYPFGNPGKNGDGISMAQKVGAELWHMYKFEGYLAFKAPEYDAAFQIRFHGPRFIYVNKDGRRFTNETGWEAHEGWKSLMVSRPDRPSYPHLPVYAIFDDVARRRGPLYALKTGANRDRYKWSLDNSREISRGWVHRGNTIRELAKKVIMDKLTLETTVAKYNEYCREGRDNDFDRAKETLEAIEVAPYYAIELWPGVINTQGGPRRDKGARVLNCEGKPIPRLYSAGELGSFWGFLYPGGNITESLIFGRIAGRNAASEKPW